MTREQTKYLLKIARKSIEHFLLTKENLSIPEPESAELLDERAVFVTLTSNNELRGCIGHMVARMPLYKAVAEMALAAALEDHRFMPVTLPDLSGIQIEISILTPMQRIVDYRKIKIGRDGVLVRKGFRSGVYLPQVAVDTGWDLETFLTSLCAHKAGLSAQAYKDSETELFIFQIDKISEEDF